MIVGVPKEIKVHESRVAITPEGVSEFVHAGHTVIIEDKAGVGSSITNEEFIAAGATIVPTADDVWQKADLVLKVKEPIEPEYPKMRKGQTLFTYLHLAASKACTDALVKSGTTAIAYETVEVNGTLPLLAPMSEVAGRLATQVGATALQKPHGGRGVLLGGVPGVAPGRVVVIGGGVAQAGEIFWEPLQKHIETESKAIGFLKNIQLRKAELERDAGILGAALAVLS